MKQQFFIVLILIIILSPMGVFADALSRNIKKLDDEKVTELAIPLIHNIQVSSLDDTWGHARDAGRSHEGIDIVVPRGTLIASPTEAVVTRIETTGNGGLVVWTLNPGNERFYYAHLDSVFAELEVGDYLEPGNIIGFVGNSGNAAGTGTHLHFGIYNYDWIAENPYSRITTTLDEESQIRGLKQFVEYLLELIKELKNART